MGAKLNITVINIPKCLPRRANQVEIEGSVTAAMMQYGNTCLFSFLSDVQVWLNHDVQNFNLFMYMCIVISLYVYNEF